MSVLNTILKIFTTLKKIFLRLLLYYLIFTIGYKWIRSYQEGVFVNGAFVNRETQHI